MVWAQTELVIQPPESVLEMSSDYLREDDHRKDAPVYFGNANTSTTFVYHVHGPRQKPKQRQPKPAAPFYRGLRKYRRRS